MVSKILFKGRLTRKGKPHCKNHFSFDLYFKLIRKRVGKKENVKL